MPRKVYSGVGYDDSYDAYDDDDYEYDYEDDYDYGVEENGTSSKTVPKQETLKTGIWRCPMCTYDNEDRRPSCEMCGVLRNPLVKVDATNQDPAAKLSADGGAKVITLQTELDSREPESSSTVMTRDRLSGPGDRDSALSSESKTAVLDRAKVTASQAELDSRERKSSSKVMIRDNRLSRSAYSDTASSSENKPPVDKGDGGRLSSKSGKAETTSKAKAGLASEYKPETWMVPEKVGNELSQLNLAIVGHVDSGKSTLSGRLLHLLGQISQKQMHKYEKEAKEQGKGSFAYAWALDESTEERERGVTMNVGVAFFTSKNYQVVLLDSPGHRDFVPNMISGATQADAAILVIDASIGSFEAGLDATGGQTREHAQLIKSFGVDQIIVLVNKMDAVEYSKERFDEIKHKLETFLRTCGFKNSSMTWIPASAMQNQNLVAKPSDTQFSWFEGPCLMEAIDSLQLPARDYSKPLVMPICDVTKSNSPDQVSAVGKLESGAIRSGVKVMVMPSREIATTRSLQRDSRPCNVARAGDNVTINLQGIEPNRVTAGGVICHPDYPIQVTNHLELKILVLDITSPILIGSQMEFHIHHAKEVAKVVKILSLIDPKTGQPTKKSPRCLLAKQNALVEVVVESPVCVEEYSKCRALGRVFLRSMGRTVALGIVTRTG